MGGQKQNSDRCGTNSVTKNKYQNRPNHNEIFETETIVGQINVI